MQPVIAVQQLLHIQTAEIILSHCAVLSVVNYFAGTDSISSFQIIGTQTLSRSLLWACQNHRSAVYITGAKPANCAFSQAVIGNYAEKGAVHSQVGQSHGNICLASAVACLKICGQTDLLVIGRCQTQHDFTNRNKLFCACNIRPQRILMFHKIPSFRPENM